MMQEATVAHTVYAVYTFELSARRLRLATIQDTLRSEITN